MSIEQLGTDVRLKVLFLDAIEALIFVVDQYSLDVLETVALNILETVGKNDGILHGVNSADSSTR